jgi:hypothetical protein
MAKKPRGKKNKKNKNKNSSKVNKSSSPKSEPLVQAEVLGDLRLIEAHVEEFLKGSEEAEAALKIMGRDAALTVEKLAKENESEELLSFARRLIPMRPEVETNLFALREQSILDIIEEALESAPSVSESPVVADQSIAFSVFDPFCVGDVLIRTGRIRTDPKRLGQGDLALYPLALEQMTDVQLTAEPVPDGQVTSDVWLRVQSGVVFIGPPEATDGERLGSIRFDPFSTKLNQHLERGGFVRVEPGCYQVRAFDGGDKVCVHLTSIEEAPTEELPLIQIQVPPPVN